MNYSRNKVFFIHSTNSLTTSDLISTDQTSVFLVELKVYSFIALDELRGYPTVMLEQKLEILETYCKEQQKLKQGINISSFKPKWMKKLKKNIFLLHQPQFQRLRISENYAGEVLSKINETIDAFR